VGPPDSPGSAQAQSAPSPTFPEEIPFDGHRGGRTALVWRTERGGAAPLILTSHFGSSHKAGPEVLEWAAIATGAGFHVASIDGPVHGQNSDHPEDPVRVIDDFRRLWSDSDGGIEHAVGDWASVIATLSAAPGPEISAIGWFGMSMGTAYGVPLLSEHPEVSAAVLGMWPLSYPNSARIRSSGARVGCPVLFQVRSEDERFQDDDQRALFDLMTHPANRYQRYPGGHTRAGGVQLADASQHLARHLSLEPTTATHEARS
jgi:pimeloyl-ACP methyl ester carboxylesterase